MTITPCPRVPEGETHCRSAPDATVAALADYPHTVEGRESMRPDGHGLWCIIAGPTATSAETSFDHMLGADL